MLFNFNRCSRRITLIVGSAVSVFLLASLGSAYADTASRVGNFQPVFPPSYKPDPASDEGGLWFVMNKFEADLDRGAYTVNESELKQHVDEMVCKLAGEYCSDIRVYIIRSPHFNASMAPNGMMSVYTGLLMRVSSDDELAAVLGHEIGHFLLAHQIKQWRRLRSSLGFAAFADFVLGGFATLAMSLSGLSYSRVAETDSDLYGLQLMHEAGYDTDTAAQLWEYLERERDADLSKTRGPSFFRTHPETPQRAARLRRESAALKQPSASTQPKVARRLTELLTPHYMQLMNSQVEMQELEQLRLMIERHRKIGFPEAQVTFFEGEMYRLRKRPGDRDRAVDAYRSAISSDKSMWQAHRELAYLALKDKQSDTALTHFRRYKELSPDADDHAMTNYYIQLLEKQ